MNLDLRQLLGGDTARLRYIKRFSTCRTVSTETVAEHVCYVSLYCLLIGDWVNIQNGVLVDMGKLLTRAVIHDLEECRTGDFPRDFKYSSPEMKRAIDAAAVTQFNNVIDEVVDVVTYRDTLADEWKHAKDGTTEGRILEFADFLSALAFICEEKKVGNYCLSQHTGTLTQYLEKFDAVGYEFLAPLVKQAKLMVREVLA